MKPYLSVIVPAFNEENVIADNIGHIDKFLQDYLTTNKPWEILVVNDGSRDGTPKVLEELSKTNPRVRVATHKRNLGRGRAIRTGFESSSGLYVITMDADLSYSPDHIAKLLPPLETDTADIVLASAYHPEGEVANVPFSRALVSKAGNKILSRAVDGGLRTVTCVVRGYTREVIEALPLFSDDKDLHLEIIQKAQMLSFRILEVPAVLKWEDAKRSSGKKGLSLKQFNKMLNRHLFINFILRPSMLLWIPIFIVSLCFFVLSGVLLFNFYQIITTPSLETGFDFLYAALRLHIINAKLTYGLWSFCLLVLFFFFSLTFLAKQAKYNYKDLFLYLQRIERKLDEN